MSNQNWTDAAMVFLRAKTCPHCGGRKFIHVWSHTETDGSVTQRQICERCSNRIKFIYETPEMGNIDDPEL